MIASAVGIVVGVLGSLLYCIKHRCYTVMYGIILFFIWLVALIVGIVLVGISVKGNSVVNSICSTSDANTGSESIDQGINFVSNIVEDLDSVMGKIVNDNMCTI